MFYLSGSTNLSNDFATTNGNVLNQQSSKTSASGTEGDNVLDKSIKASVPEASKVATNVFHSFKFTSTWLSDSNMKSKYITFMLM